MPYDIKVHRGDTTLSLTRTQLALDDLDIRVAASGGGGGGGSGNVFIQSSPPSATGNYLWIDTSGGNINFWVNV